MSEAVMTPEPAAKPAAVASAVPRVWPGLAIAAAYWAYKLIAGQMETTIFVGFFTWVGATALFLLLFLIWWFAASRMSWTDRVLGLVALVASGLLANRVSDPSMKGFGSLFFALPVVLTAWVIWLAVARNSSLAARRAGLLAVFCLTWGYFALIRMDGVDGSQKTDFNWRWTPRAEELFLAHRAQTKETPSPASPSDLAPEPVTLQEGDWPAFRGPLRDGVQSGVAIATDWNAAPPKLLWKQRVGPAWSSVAIVGNRLFTQEQRGEKEAVVCLDAETGHELWAHEDAARFAEPVAGPGPRATPTFVDGNLYTFGAKGVLNCLDAASGSVQWSRDVTADSGAPVPMWGFSSSPLVADAVVVVCAGGEGGKGLLAYRADSGEPAWTAPTGKQSYSSPQLASIGGETQLLFFSETGLTAFDPVTGKVLWEHAAPASNWRAVQPHAIGDAGILIGSEDLGLVLLDVTRSDNALAGNAWVAGQRWATKAMKPAYNDFVVYDGYVYGFDGGVFGCVELRSGKRQWKAGRYGHGQVLLLADQQLLLVLSETGEVVLVATDPQKLEELSRFQAIQGKTWNHPVVAHGRLYVRNDEELACFNVRPTAMR
jgi:outer membrane protein assembly factor BamB